MATATLSRILTNEDRRTFLEQEKAEERRKTRILMDILMAGEAVESVILKHRDEIDEKLLDLLEKRTRLAARSALSKERSC